MKRNKYTTVLLFILMTILGCSESLEDTYKKYTGDGEIRYLGQCSNLSVKPGWKRLIVKWTNNVDPNVAYVKVVWSKDDQTNECVLEKGVAEYDITNLEEDGNYEISVYGVDKDGNKSIVNTVYGRPYTEYHEEVMAFTRLISRHFFVKNRVILTFSGWDVNLKSAVLKYTKINGDEGSVEFGDWLVMSGFTRFIVPDDVDTSKPVVLYRTGSLPGCDDIIEFEPYVLEHKIMFEADMKQELKRQYGFDENIPEDWVNEVEELELDWNFGSLEDLLNFPNLKKLILGKNRYLLDENAANDAEHGQSKLYDEIASYDNMNWTALTFSQFVLQTLNELNGLVVERYNKHYQALKKASYIIEKGETVEPDLPYIDLKNYVFSVYPEDKDGYNSNVNYLTDGDVNTFWQPLQLNSYTTYEMILDVAEVRHLTGLKFVQRIYPGGDNQIMIAPSSIRINVSKDQINWENATYVEENNVGNSSGEITLIPFVSGGKDARYVRLQVNTATYYGFYNTSFAEIGLY